MSLTEQARHWQEEQPFICAGLSEETLAGQRVFRSGEGPYLTDLDGNRYIDLAAGMFTQAVGHCHPEVVRRVQDQAARLSNVHDAPVPERLDLCRLLAEALPPELDTYCFLSTGAEAVEAALRIVQSAAPPGRTRVGALRYGFHGKTLGARLLVHWDDGLGSVPSNSILGYSPYCYRCPFDLRYPGCDLLCARLVKRHICDKPNVAAFVFEPVLGAAGVIVPPPGYWEIVQQACTANGVVMVADEIITGGGRTGAFLASTLFGLRPDLVTLAKGVGSGVPFSIVAGRKSLLNSERFSAPGSCSATFASNPLGIAAASATLEVIRRDRLIERVRMLGQRVGERLRALHDRYACVGDVRGIGLLHALEFVRDRRTRAPAPEIARRVFTAAMDGGVRVCLGGHILRLAPPFNIPVEVADEALAILEGAVAAADAERAGGGRAA